MSTTAIRANSVVSSVAADGKTELPPGALPASIQPEASGGPAGRCLGPWRLLRPLGQGGMGSVWLGERADGRFERTAAIKVLPAVHYSQVAATRFAEETRVLGKLEHPGIVRLLDAGTNAQGEAWLITEFAEGMTLDAWVRQAQPDRRRRMAVFQVLCEAVASMHGVGIAHLDLKPTNVIVTPDDRPKLLDFGLAREEQGGCFPRRAEEIFTPAYASPEQISGEPVSRASDVFSLGLILYELIAGAHPFRDEPGQEQVSLTRLRERTPPPPSSQGGGRSWRDLDVVIGRALAWAPAERFPAASELAAELARLLADEPIRSRSRPMRQLWRRLPMPVLATVLAGLAAWGAILGLRNRAERNEAATQAQRERNYRAALVMVDDLAAGLARMSGPTEAQVRLLEEAAVTLAANAPDAAARARAELRLGRAYRNLGRLDPALRRAEAGRAIAARAAMRDSTPAELAILAAELLAAQGQSAAAGTAFLEARRALNWVQPATLEDVAVARTWLMVEAHLLHRATLGGRVAEARQEYGTFAPQARTWTARWPLDPEIQRIASMGTISYSILLRQIGEAEAARAATAEGLAWARRSLELAPTDPFHRLSYARSIGRLALDLDRRGVEGALKLLREARELHRLLLESDPNNALYAYEFISASSALARLEVRLGESGIDQSPAQSGVEVARRFLSRTSEVRLHLAAAAVLQSLAGWHAASQRPAEAGPLCTEALEVLERMPPATRAQPSARELEAEIRTLLAATQAPTGLPKAKKDGP